MYGSSGVTCSGPLGSSHRGPFILIAGIVYLLMQYVSPWANEILVPSGNADVEGPPPIGHADRLDRPLNPLSRDANGACATAASLFYVRATLRFTSLRSSFHP